MSAHSSQADSARSFGSSFGEDFAGFDEEGSEHTPIPIEEGDGTPQPPAKKIKSANNSPVVHTLKLKSSPKVDKPIVPIAEETTPQPPTKKIKSATNSPVVHSTPKPKPSPKVEKPIVTVTKENTPLPKLQVDKPSVQTFQPASHSKNVILDLLTVKNKPMTAGDMTTILNKDGKLSKTAFLKNLEGLVEDEKVTEKAYGKQKVYVVNQSTLPVRSTDELKAMDLQINQLKAGLEEKKTALTKLQNKLKALNVKPSLEQLTISRDSLKEELEKKTKLLESAEAREKENRPSTPVEKLSESDLKKRIKERDLYLAAWRKNKRIANDILNAVMEGYPHSLAKLIEETGIETDESLGITFPKV